MKQSMVTSHYSIPHRGCTLKSSFETHVFVPSQFFAKQQGHETLKHFHLERAVMKKHNIPIPGFFDVLEIFTISTYMMFK